MADISSVKTYILKVNLQCCEACSKKLEKVLMNTNGVYGYKINTKEGLVNVACKVDLDILKKIIKKKTGKIVEIYEPKRDKKNDFDSSGDNHAHNGVHDMRPMPRGASDSSTSGHHPQNSITKGGFDPRMLGTNVPMPQPVIARPPYYREVQYRSSGHSGPGIYNRPTPTAPPLPPHGCYGTMLPLEPPKGNSMVHAINYDNVRAIAPRPPPHGYYGANVRAQCCTIM